MAISETYSRQAALPVRVIPLAAEETCFALKGGTAINLFVRDMPRLPVADKSAGVNRVLHWATVLGNRKSAHLVINHS